MKHKIGSQGFVVPFGYVTATIDGHERVFQQGQFILPDAIVTKVEGDSDIDTTRTAEALKTALGVSDKSWSTSPGTTEKTDGA